MILVTADHSQVFTIAGYPSRGNLILGKTAVDGVALTDSLGLPYTTLSYANGPGWTGGLQRKEFNPANEGTLLDQKLLAQLTAGGMEWSDGYPTREYQGKLAETEWHIVMRMDIGLPMLIERQHEGLSERTELLNAYALNNAPWRPTPAHSYDVIDFADLGDKEYDPFVIKVQAQMSHDHHH